MHKLRPYQQEICDWAMATYEKGPLAISAPTACGKTHMAKSIADYLPGRTAIVTYSNDLVGQFYREFPLPAFIGAANYKDVSDKLAAYRLAQKAKCVLFNPATYLIYKKKEDSVPFDNIIIDEADACLSLFKQLVPTTIDWPSGMTPSIDTIVRQLIEDGKESFSHIFAARQQHYWWETVEFFNKKLQQWESSLKIHDVCLPNSFASKYLPKNIVLMSGTLFPSYCRELLGTDDYNLYEAPSPIPVERRQIDAFTQESGWEFPADYTQMLELLDATLKKYPQRPAIVHTTYADVGALQAIRAHLDGYKSKEDKLIALQAIEGTDKVLLTPGAVEGLDLKDNRARLNIILRANFPNLGAMSVYKRRSLPDGQQWYLESTLRSFVQAAGRTTRGPTDHSKIVVADVRLTRLLQENVSILPKYIVEACTFI